MIRTLLLLVLFAPAAGATTYYVSSVSGDDNDDGLTPGTAFASVNHVNGLALLPGDEVRFACGETFRAQALTLIRSGTSGQPITITSDPPGCLDKPLLSGAEPISGWSLHQGSIYVADLSAGANSGRFAFGVNQLFRGAGRLPFGRWPDRQGHADGGWATIDSQPASNRITDSELPVGDWTGAVAHIRGMTWYIYNRAVTADSSSTLTLGVDNDCWGGNCAGWGYYLSNHLATLSQEGEWFFDAATDRLYLVSNGGLPIDDEIEGSVVLRDDGRFHGGVILGRDLNEHLSWVTVENLRIEKWFDSGVSTPTNYELDDSSNLILRQLEIRDVDSTGIHLAVWIWNAGGESGWRGGHDLLIEDVMIERANHHGLDSYAHSSVFSNVSISDVGLMENLGASGMGCGITGSGGFCTEAGAGVRLKRHLAAHSSHHLTLSGFEIDRTGMNGIDIFGDTITVTGSVVRDACQSKSDCGAIRTFGNNNLANPVVFDVQVIDSILLDALANNQGCHVDFRFPLAFGLYFDQGSSQVSADGVTIAGCRPSGILYQNSTGEVRNSIVYDTQASTWGGTAIRVVGSSVMTLFNSVIFSLGSDIDLVWIENLGQLFWSNNNSFFQPRTGSGLCVNGSCSGLAEWQAATGQDSASTTSWYSLGGAEPARSALFTNPTSQPATADLSGAFWLDLNRAPVFGRTLAPWAGEVLVADPSLIFVDGFESGDTSQWSASTP